MHTLHRAGAPVR